MAMDTADVPLATVDSIDSEAGEYIDNLGAAAGSAAGADHALDHVVDTATLPAGVVDIPSPPPPVASGVLCNRIGTPMLEVGGASGAAACSLKSVSGATGKTACFRIFSVVYALAAVASCLVFVITEIITNKIPLYFFEVFFTYMYGASVLFLLYVFIYLLHESSTKVGRKRQGVGCCGKKSKSTSADEHLNEAGSPEKLTKEWKPYKTKTSDSEHSHGGFFLRIGAIAFGLGTMVYNGMELGMFFEIPSSSQCWQILMAVNPCLQATFTFMQMYFIFMNSRLNIHKFKCLARFGLMHMIATNVCVWIRTVVRESLRVYTDYNSVNNLKMTQDFLVLDPVRRLGRRLLQFQPLDGASVTGDMGDFVTSAPDFLSSAASVDTQTYTPTVVTPSMPPSTAIPPIWPVATISDVLIENHIVPGVRDSSLDVHMGGGGSEFSCNRTDIMGSIVNDASPYLFPLIVEYSLIGAAVLYVMWENIGRCPRYLEEDDIPDHISVTSRKAHTKVDCIGASKGLFCGLLVCVAAIISLVLYFVLIDHKQKKHRQLAIFLADTSHASILLLMIIGALIGCCRNRKLKFVHDKPDILNAILLRVSAFGLFVYSAFCVLSAAVSPLPDVPNLLVLVASGMAILQVLVQLLYVSDVSKRCVYLPEHDLTKPGRQMVTFMLLCNLALCAVYTFEIDKVRANPVQLNFYGSLNWAVILRVTLPLAIFHRFYSAVVLAEVWKSSYKARAD